MLSSTFVWNLMIGQLSGSVEDVELIVREEIDLVGEVVGCTTVQRSS
jgi:hypothetical protein